MRATAALVGGLLAACTRPAAANIHGRWATVGEQKTIPDPFAKGISQLSVRYSHTAAVFEDQMIVTHGYFYNRNAKPSQPAWLHDTWSFSFKSGRWSILHDGKKGAPSPRYGHSTFMHDGGMYIFGGDDGDHKASPTNYRSHHFNDVWRFDMAARTWQEIKPAAGSPVPAPRSLHGSGLVGNSFVVYGGLGHNDTWSFDLSTATWSKHEIRTHQAHPGTRYASSYAAVGDKLYIFGGARRGGFPIDDLWSFEPATGLWTRLSVTAEAQTKLVEDKLWPPGRSYGSLAAATTLAGAPALVLYGGANCTRGCQCKGDSWVYDIAARSFSFVEVSTDALPIARYRQSLVDYNSKLYVFGGESYKPYMYHNSVSELSLTAEKTAAPAANPLAERLASLRGSGEVVRAVSSAVASSSSSTPSAKAPSGLSSRSSATAPMAAQSLSPMNTIMLVLAVVPVAAAVVWWLCRKVAAPGDEYSRSQAAKP